jgi:hypothetical protein
MERQDRQYQLDSHLFLPQNGLIRRDGPATGSWAVIFMTQRSTYSNELPNLERGDLHLLERVAFRGPRGHRVNLQLYGVDD